jgi:hypothetical protein
MMPGFGESRVEPNVTVKCCALRIILSIFPKLAAAGEGQAGSLDDVMTATIHAIEAKRIELDALAFEILRRVVDAFRAPLQIYESQFAVAIRASFPHAIDASSDFHVCYLDAAMRSFAENPRGCLILIETYVKGLSAVSYGAGWFAICAQLCAIARENAAVFRAFAAFFEGLAGPFAELLLDTVKLRTGGSDWAQLSLYRAKMEGCYRNFLGAAVWLRKVFHADGVLTTAAIVAFLLLELTASTEGWRVFAAFAALTAVLPGCDLVETVVGAMLQVARTNMQLLKSLVPQFLSAATAVLPQSALWPAVAATALNYAADAAVLARVLKFVSWEVIVTSLHQYTDFVIGELREATVCEAEAVALMTIVFDRAPIAIPSILPRIFAVDGFVKFKLRIIERAYARIETRAAIDQIANFLTANLDEEALRVLGAVLLKRPAIGDELLKRGVADQCINRIFHSGSGLTVLYILHLIFDRLCQFTEVCLPIARAALRTFGLEGYDRVNGEMICVLTISLLRKCDRIRSQTTDQAFLAMGASTKAELIHLLQKYTMKKPVKRVALMRFSSAPSRRSTDETEWQKFDVDD